MSPYNRPIMKVLVIVTSGLRLGHLACYGNEWIDTPSFDDLAAASVVFDQHIADRPDAAGARRGWRTGRYDFPALDAVPSLPQRIDLVKLLRQHDVATSLVVDASRPATKEFSKGWDHVRTVPRRGDGTPMERTLEAAVEALEECEELDHWLVWVELATLLPPWDLPEEYRDRYLAADVVAEDEKGNAVEPEPLEALTDPEPGRIDPADDTTFLRLQRTYAGAVTYLDTGLGMLLEELENRGLLDEIHVLLMGDRGLPLGEHGAVGEVRPWLHAERTHVPLIVRFPGAAEAGRRVAALTQSVDVMPTLLELFAVPPPLIHGNSLLPLARGAVEAVRSYAAAGLQVGDGVEWLLRSPEWAFLLPVAPFPEDGPRVPQLYVKPEDPWEVNDLVQHHQDWAEQLEKTLRAFVVATRGPGPLQYPPLPRSDADEPAD